jgi:hypothetical protein
MNIAEAITFMREAVGNSKPKPPRPPAPVIDPLPTDVIVRDPDSVQWARRERWITTNGAMPLPLADDDALRRWPPGALTRPGAAMRSATRRPG